MGGDVSSMLYENKETKNTNKNLVSFIQNNCVLLMCMWKYQPFRLSEYAHHVASKQDGKKLISGDSLLEIIEENGKCTKYNLGNNTDKR